MPNCVANQIGEGRLPLGIDAVLHHLRWEDLGEHDMQGRSFVVPIIRVIIARPRFKLAVQSQAFLQVGVLLQNTGTLISKKD